MDEATSPPKNDPFTLFQPREIFALPGKRSRHEFDTDAPLTAPEAEERATRQVRGRGRVRVRVRVRVRPLTAPAAERATRQVHIGNPSPNPPPGPTPAPAPTPQVEIPSEDDIRLSIQSMQKLSKFR